MSETIFETSRPIAREMLSDMHESEAAKAEANAKAKAERDAAKLISDKAAQLAKRYPNLLIVGQERDSRVRIETKYGAGIHLDCYAYQDSRSGDWRLTSDRSTSFSLDKLDSAYGRAFLKLCNDN